MDVGRSLVVASILPNTQTAPQSPQKAASCHIKKLTDALSHALHLEPPHVWLFDGLYLVRAITSNGRLESNVPVFHNRTRDEKSVRSASSQLPWQLLGA